MSAADRQHQVDVPQCWCGYPHRPDPAAAIARGTRATVDPFLWPDDRVDKGGGFWMRCPACRGLVEPCDLCGGGGAVPLVDGGQVLEWEPAAAVAVGTRATIESLPPRTPTALPQLVHRGRLLLLIAALFIFAWAPIIWALRAVLR